MATVLVDGDVRIFILVGVAIAADVVSLLHDDRGASVLSDLLREDAAEQAASYDHIVVVTRPLFRP